MRELFFLIKSDLMAYHLDESKMGVVLLIKTILFSAKFRVLVRYRFSAWLVKKKFPIKTIANILYNTNLNRSVDMHPLTKIGSYVRIPHPCGIVIGEDAIIGSGVRIQQGVTVGGNGKKTLDDNGVVRKMPLIEDLVLLGPGSCVLGPIRVGRGAVIGANTVVTTDVPDWAICTAGAGKINKIISEEEWLMSSADVFSSRAHKWIKNQ